MNDKIILYREEQRFTQWWLWLLLGGIAVIPLIGIYQQLILKKPFGDNPMSDAGLIAFAIIMLGVLYFFRLMRLVTEVSEEGIQFSYFPFFKKTVKRQEIKSLKVVNYGFVGYGIRYGSMYGVVYNTAGSKGLAVEKTNEDKFVIGTQQPEELSAFIEANLRPLAIA